MFRRDSVPAEYDRKHTQLAGTETRRGFVDHLQVIFAGHLIFAPVVLVGHSQRSDNGGLRDPKINTDGRYIHMLPGGVEVVGRMA